MRRIILTAILALLPVPSFAAESNGSGTLLERITALRTQIEARVPASTGALLPNAAKQKTWDTEKARHEQRLWELRAKCREELRKANRDTIAAKAQQCVRSDLMEELAMRRKEKAYMESLPALDPVILKNYSDTTAALMDAEVAIVDGIDSNVYTSVELLQTAKRKLREQYRVPYWKAAFRLSADRVIPWVAWHVSRVEELLTEEPEIEAESAVQCLEETVNLLSIASSEAFGGTLMSVRAALSKSQECAATLQLLVEPEGQLPEGSL